MLRKALGGLDGTANGAACGGQKKGQGKKRHWELQGDKVRMPSGARPVNRKVGKKRQGGLRLEPSLGKALRRP